MKIFRKITMGVFVLALVLMLAAPQAMAAYSVKKILYRVSATAGEALATGEVVCLKDADGYAYQADSNDAALRPAIGVVGSKTASASGETVEIIVIGVLTGWSSLSEGGNGYLSETAAAVTQAAPSWSQKVGFALNTTDYFFSFQNYFDSSAVTSLGVLSGTTPIILEGDTADAHETTIAPEDPTADNTVTVPDDSGIICLVQGAEEAADGIWGTTAGDLVFEGNTADDHETTFDVTDPTADNSLTVPDDSGAIVFSPGGSTTSDADSLAIPVTHAYVAKTTGADAEALTLANGENGQILTIDLDTDGNGTGTLTPATCTGFSTIVFADAGDNATLLYVDDVVGWIIMGAAGVAAPPIISD